MGARPPIVCVLGLWHLGSVTAACLAARGARVIGLDRDEAAVRGLAAGRAPVFEPGLDDLLRTGLASGALRFTTDVAEAVREADVLWVAIDTPVDDEDRGDAELVVSRVVETFAHLKRGAVVLISSQLPVGTTARLESLFRTEHADRAAAFACSPENLRLGAAIEAFLRPDRIVVGLRDPESRPAIEALLAPIGAPLEWMSAESAEMTKHAINAFLATSIVFMNEVSKACEGAGADAKEVERGLKSEARIGPRAYLAPGAAIAGGTLLRDVRALERLAPAPSFFSAVAASNRAHADWPRRKLGELLGALAGRTIAVLGLAYKPGTDVVRRSSAVELCRALAADGAEVRAHDPVVKALPPEIAGRVSLAASPEAAARGAHALVLATAWPEYRALDVEGVIAHMRSPVVVDAGRALAATFGRDPRVRYAAVGAPR